MDSQIIYLIDREVALLPRSRSRNRKYRWRLYEAGKTKLYAKFRGHEEYIAKAIAQKYRV